MSLYFAVQSQPRISQEGSQGSCCSSWNMTRRSEGCATSTCSREVCELDEADERTSNI